jgi:hypothetical protein
MQRLNQRATFLQPAAKISLFHRFPIVLRKEKKSSLGAGVCPSLCLDASVRARVRAEGVDKAAGGRPRDGVRGEGGEGGEGDEGGDGARGGEASASSILKSPNLRAARAFKRETRRNYNAHSDL